LRVGDGVVERLLLFETPEHVRGGAIEHPAEPVNLLARQ
jgi:hypothetical protein